MNQEISKKLMCVQMREGQEIWMEDEKAEQLKAILVSARESKFISYEGRVLNTADVVGIFTAEDMESVKRRKNGQWQGKDGKWHDKGERTCPKCGNILPFGKQCGICG